MIRVIRLSGKYYGCELPDDPHDIIEECSHFIDSGEPVILVNDIEDLAYGLDIDPSEVEMVERADD